MRKITVIAVISAIVASGFPSTPVLAQAQLASAGAIMPADPMTMISSTINAFPNGGEPLKLAITDLIVKHPNLASNIAVYLRNNPSLTSAQKQAIVAGLADAMNRLGVVAQVGGMDPLLLAFLAAGGALGGFAIYQATHKTTTTVSPN